MGSVLVAHVPVLVPQLPASASHRLIGQRSHDQTPVQSAQLAQQ